MKIIKNNTTYRLQTHGLRLKLFKTVEYSHGEEEVEIMKNSSISQISKKIASLEKTDAWSIERDIKEMVNAS